MIRRVEGTLAATPKGNDDGSVHFRLAGQDLLFEISRLKLGRAAVAHLNAGDQVKIIAAEKDGYFNVHGIIRNGRPIGSGPMTVRSTVTRKPRAGVTGNVGLRVNDYPWPIHIYAGRLAREAEALLDPGDPVEIVGVPDEFALVARSIRLRGIDLLA